MTPEERANHFHKTFPQYSQFTVHNGRLYGFWVIGALYARKNGSLYGSFPYSVEKRILALFPDCRTICHLFSGTLKAEESLGSVITYDINPKANATITDDIVNIGRHKEKLEDVDLFVADPPYDHPDFEKYGVKPFDKADVIREIGEVAKGGAYMAWLDTKIPIYNKKTWQLLGHIGMAVSTNTRVRCLTLWERTTGFDAGF